MVAILSIGTEITTGQILNRNAQWLSTELLHLGINVSLQLAVPDQSELIRDALIFLERRCRLILTTGGLGPTSDDFTRNVIAATYQKPLIWHEDNWCKVQHKLNLKKVQIRDLHKQQCFYPENSEILENNQGIADAFYLKTPSVELYVLPGPPREIEAIWCHSLKKRLLHYHSKNERWVQKIWTIKGLPESEVASKILVALGDKAQKVLYRAHSPYVDVKLLYQEQESSDYQKLAQQLQDTLKPWLTFPGDIHD